MHVTALDDIIEGYLDLRQQMDPVAATASGRHDLDTRFAAFDRSSVREFAAAVRSYASSLEEADADSLDDEIDRTAALHAARHDLLVLERERPFAHNPALHLSHAMQGIVSLVGTLEASPAERTAALLARLRALPAFLAVTREAVSDPAPLFVEQASTLIPAALELLRDRLDEAPLDRTAVEESEWAAARAKAVDAVIETADWLTLTSETATGSAAIGRELYERKLHTAHMIRDGADELARFGERLRVESEAELAREAALIEEGADWRALVERLDDVEAEHRAAAAACEGSLSAAAAALGRKVRRVLGTPATRDGWTLYCTGLVTEEGAQATAAHRLLVARDRLLAAHLLLLDISLHARGERPEEGARRLAESLSLPPGEAEAIVRRAAAAPTTLAGAAVGWRDITALRDEARAARGARWSAPHFHRELLAYGALPTALARWGMGLA
ncbi:MAG TPA: DUF885 family protein [Gemmatimonadaceae bacterium]|nr:DUF885 family protein [Gemmatimonadaceae bacterium]